MTRSVSAAVLISSCSESLLVFWLFPSSQLSGGGGPGVLLNRPTPTRRAFGRGRGGGVSGSSRRFRKEGWTDRGVTKPEGLVRSSELDIWVRRRWWIRSLTDGWALDDDD